MGLSATAELLVLDIMWKNRHKNKHINTAETLPIRLPLAWL